MKPVVIEKNGVRFGFVSLGQLEPNVFATDDTPGIAVLDEENLRAAIDAAKQVSDVVIVLPHWGPEDVPNPNWSQRDLARIAIDAGADCIITACAMCHMNLEARCSLKAKVPILHFSEIISLALGIGKSEYKGWFSRHLVDPRPLLKALNLL
jgi:hypothetical protein